MPAYCAQHLVYTEQILITGQMGTAAVFDGTSVTVHYDGAVDLCGSSPDGITYEVTIMVQLHTTISYVYMDIVLINPCTSMVMTMDLPIIAPFQYILGATIANTWQHQTILSGTPAMCGPLTYTANLGALASVVTYNMATRTFMISTDNSALLANSPYTYTVTSAFLNYPGYGQKTAQGTITLIDACLEPAVFQVGIPINADSDYITPAIFTFPTTTVVPVICLDIAVYSCTYVSGPYQGQLDLCGLDFSNGNFQTTITFNVLTGQLIFNTDDHETFPHGEYTYTITITIGYVVRTTTVIIILHPGCGDSTLTVV